METSPLCSPFRASSMASDVESEEAILRVSVIPAIDLRFMSQDDLNCLAALSDEFRHLRRDDVIVPKIDWSVFNESVGSRKQTYSRLRLAQSKDDASAVGRRRTGLLVVSRHQGNSVDDSEQRDNDRIVRLLRELFAKDRSTVLYPSKNRFPARVSDVAERSEARSAAGMVGKVDAPRPRKRRKKDDVRKVQISSSQAVPDGRLESGGRSYSDGARDGVVDILSLATEDVFVMELRRTTGLASEADMVAFLSALAGRWAGVMK